MADNPHYKLIFHIFKNNLEINDYMYSIYSYRISLLKVSSAGISFGMSMSGWESKCTNTRFENGRWWLPIALWMYGKTWWWKKGKMNKHHTFQSQWHIILNFWIIQWIFVLCIIFGFALETFKKCILWHEFFNDMKFYSNLEKKILFVFIITCTFIFFLSFKNHSTILGKHHHS